MPTKKKIEKLVGRVMKTHRRALLGLAHYDKGVKVKGCDCCFCGEVEQVIKGVTK